MLPLTIDAHFVTNQHFVTPVFVLSSTQVEATKPFKGEKKYEYDSLLSILKYLKLSKDQEAHSAVKLISNAKALKSSSTLYRKVSWVLSQFACVLKKVLISMVIQFSCLRSQDNQSDRGDGIKGRYTDNTVAAVINGGGGKEGVCV